MALSTIGKQFYTGIIGIGNALQSPLLLAMRLFWGYQFFKAGIGKFLNLSSVAEYFSSLGIPLPTLNVLIAGSIECFGGLCLLIGLASRLVSIPLAFTMLIALFTADIEAVWGAFQDPANLLSRAPITFLMTTLIIFVFGPGKYSIDYLLEKKYS